MHDYKKLNSYVESLQSCDDELQYDELFTDFYLELSDIWSSKGVIGSLAYKYHLDADEVLSIANIKILDVIKTFNTSQGHFYHYLSASIANACKQRAKENNKHANANVSSFETSMEDNPAFIPYIPHANAEGDAVEFLQKESEQHKLPTSLLESEQCRLLTSLLERADDKCRQAVAALSKSKSYREVAKHLGISHPAAKRRVEKVAKQFNSDVHGSIYDYLTVPTTNAYSA